MLYIKDPNFSDVAIVDIVSEETKRSVLKLMGETFETVRLGKDFNTRSISISTDDLLDDIMRNKDVLLQLTDIRTVDNAMYIHALNVSTIAILIGIQTNLPSRSLKNWLPEHFCTTLAK